MSETWQVGPENRWAYVHVDEVVPTVVVPRGDRVRELPRGEPEPSSCPTYTDGLAVVRDGALVTERYGGEMDEDSLHLSQSVGKSVLGLLVAVLGLDTATPVTDLVPEVRGSGYDGATLRHLLDMTAAIAFVEDYAVDFWRYDVACGWHPPRAGADAETVLDFLPTIGPAEWAHGERFHYATPNTDLAGVATERAAGAPLAELISRELWAPAGAERDALLTVDSAGTATIGGGFCATLRDYARFGLLARESGAALGQRRSRGVRAQHRPVDPLRRRGLRQLLVAPRRRADGARHPRPADRRGRAHRRGRPLLVAGRRRPGEGGRAPRPGQARAGSMTSSSSPEYISGGALRKPRVRYSR